MKRLNIVLATIIALLLVQGALTHWAEQTGFLTKGNRESQDNKKTLEIDMNKETVVDFALDPVPGHPQFPNAFVELFITSSCYKCGLAQEFFDRHGVTVILHHIRRDESARLRLKFLDEKRRLPLAVINSRVIPGYHPKEYLTALGQE